MTDIDTAIALDKPGTRSLTTTSQLQAQIDLCADEVITLQQFYIYVATELGAVTLADWDYLAANNCVPSEEMVRSLLTKIDGWQVVNTSQLHKLTSGNAESSLEQVVELVDSWMGDESGYDEQAHPEIEEGLTANDRRENPPC